MKKYYSVIFLTLLIILPLLSLAISNFAFAASPDNMLWGGTTNQVQSQTGLGNKDPREMAAQVVNVMLGFLGIIAVIIILLGGFRWMTAAGNEDKVAEAKRIIGAGIIGLVIIMAAFGVAQFVLNSLYGATGATG